MSLIADSLKKIEKGENDTPKNEGGIVAPPLMQKKYGSSKKASGGGSGGRPPKLIIYIVLGIVIIAGGSGAFLYMTGGLDSFFAPAPQPVPLVERNMPMEQPVQEPEATTFNLQGDGAQGNNIMGENQMGMAENQANTELPVADIFETESAQDMANSGATEPVATFGERPVNEPGAMEQTAKAETPVQPNTPANTVTPEVAPVQAEKQPKPVTPKMPVVAKVEKKPAPANVAAKKNTATKPVAKNVPTKQAPKNIPAPAKQLPINDKLAYTSLIARGESAAEQKDYLSAIDFFKEAAKIENSNILMGNIAALYIKNGQPAEASEIVVVNSIKDPDIVAGLIVDMSSNKYFVQALVLLKYAEANLSTGAQMLYSEAYYYEMQRGYVKAADYYRQAFEMNPKEAAYLYAYARTLDYSEQYYKALESYMKVVAMKPDMDIKVPAEQRMRALQGYLRKPPQ